MNGLIRNPFNFFWNGLFLPLLGWIFIVPFTYIVPRRKKRIILWGRDCGLFTDNVKYLYLHLVHNCRSEGEFYFLTESGDVFSALSERKLPVLFYPRLKTAWMLLRAGVIVSDSDVWINRFRYHLLFTAFSVQLWHGVGLKTIGLDNPQVKRMLRHPIMRAYYRLKGKLVRYDLLITTGDAFLNRGYVTGINKKRTRATGYPRNDVFFSDFSGDEMIGADRQVFTAARQFREQGGKVAVYLPTFRDTGRDAITDKILDIEVLDRFCREKRLLMIFKFHSWGMIKDSQTRASIAKAGNILIYDNTRDIYPLLPLTDVMISDYSSVYMDYLLLDRPVVFFTYDLDDYLKNERDFYFSYDELTPGLKCRDQNELQQGLTRCLVGDDGFSAARQALCQRTFNNADGRSSARVWELVRDRNKGECKEK